MAITWEDVVSSLEHTTACLLGVQAEDFLAVAQAMNDRSVAVAQLREFAAQPSEPITPPLLSRLRQDFESGAAFSKRLLLARAAAHAELCRVTEGGFMARSLNGGQSQTRRLVNCLG